MPDHFQIATYMLNLSPLWSASKVASYSVYGIISGVA